MQIMSKSVCVHVSERDWSVYRINTEGRFYICAGVCQTANRLQRGSCCSASENCVFISINIICGLNIKWINETDPAVRQVTVLTSCCRWSIMVYETKFPRQHSASTVTEDCSDDSEVTGNAFSRFSVRRGCYKGQFLRTCCNHSVHVCWSRFSRFSPTRTRWLLTCPRSWPQTSTLSSSPQPSTNTVLIISIRFGCRFCLYTCLLMCLCSGFCVRQWRILWLVLGKHTRRTRRVQRSRRPWPRRYETLHISISVSELRRTCRLISLFLSTPMSLIKYPVYTTELFPRKAESVLGPRVVW